MKFRIGIAVVVISLLFIACQKLTINDYQKMIDRGEFSRAEKLIKERLSEDKNITESERKQMEFELERMNRIRKDFTKTREEVVAFIKQYIPDVTDKDLERWEKEKKLEYMVIDGQKRYFNHAARNLFRLDKDCLRIWNAQHREGKKEKFDLDGHIRQVISESLQTGEPYSVPVRLRITHRIEVNPDAVPAGETIRCWIPFPREIPHRQINIKLLKTEPEKYVLAPNDKLQRTIYFEKKSVAGEKTVFSVEYEYTTQGVYANIDPEKVKPVDPQGDLSRYLKEEPPHIVFLDTLKKLSEQIVGSETNPYRIAQKIFAWADTNITWASAREYSTIRNLSLYPVLNRHGDCGIQTFLLMTLFRMNGIPARWQSGWEFQPPNDSMHDWSMVYFEPYGWVPADVTYGMRKSDDPKFKFFYLNGMDSYRLIFNDDYSKPFYPPKKYFRSETIDSQRGELEWKGGNLYFDQWEWFLDWKVISD
ncbi:MAG: transglutaminase domain-containing protein [Calditrichaeota bacterium]|nr:transglutaminase domain-containing protein [Calditrichota bacterium]